MGASKELLGLLSACFTIHISRTYSFNLQLDHGHAMANADQLHAQPLLPLVSCTHCHMAGALWPMPQISLPYDRLCWSSLRVVPGVLRVVEWGVLSATMRSCKPSLGMLNPYTTASFLLDQGLVYIKLALSSAETSY